MNPFKSVAGVWGQLNQRSNHWKAVVGVLAALVLAVGMWRFTGKDGDQVVYVTPPAAQDQTPGGTPVNDQQVAQPSCSAGRDPLSGAERTLFGDVVPFVLSAEAERMIGVDPATMSQVDPCAQLDLAFDLLFAVPPQSADSAGKVCAARLFADRRPGMFGGVLELTFEPGKGVPLLDCSARTAGQVQVPEGGRLPTVTTTSVGG